MLNVHTMTEDIRLARIGVYTPGLRAVAGPPGWWTADAEAAITTFLVCPSSLAIQLPMSELRESGVPRARSASRATVYGAILAKILIDDLGMNVAETGVFIGSATACTEVSYAFELRGLKEGWDVVDPFALPNSIPSAIATQICTAIGARAFSSVHTETCTAFLSAVFEAAFALDTGRARHALALVAEETGEIQLRALSALNESAGCGNGAFGFLMSRDVDSNWRLGVVAEGICPWQASCLGPEWEEAVVVHAQPSTRGSFHSWQIDGAWALHLSESLTPTILIAEADHGWKAVGFRRAQ